MRRIVTLLAVGLVACDGVSSETDGAVDRDGAVAVIPEPVAPNLPWLASGTPPLEAPRLTPCPAGWREAGGALGLARCEPFAEGVDPLAPCPDAGAGVFAGGGCRRIGAECPADGWPAALPSGEVLFVDPTAAAGGDGSTRAAASRDLAATVASAPAGAVIALAAGVHAGPIEIMRSLTLVGACPTATRIVGGADAARSAVEIRSGTVSVSGVTVQSDTSSAVGVGGASATLEGVIVGPARFAGVRVSSGELTLRDAVVRDVDSRADGAFGTGVQVDGGGHITLERVSIARTRYIALLAAGAGSRIDGRSVAILETRPARRAPGFGIAVAATGGARIDLSELAASSASLAGLVAQQAGSVIRVRDGSLDRPVTMRLADAGWGARAEARGRVELERVSVSSAQRFGLSAENGGALALADVLVETVTDGPGIFGRGGVIDTTRVRVEGAQLLGALIGEGSALQGSDLAIVGTRPASVSLRSGTGLQLDGASSGVLERVLVQDATGQGIVVAEPETSLVATDLAVLDVRPFEDGTFGLGVAVLGARAELERVLVRRARLGGLVVGDDGAVLDLGDAVVEDIDGSVADGQRGYGIAATDDVRVLVTRARVARCHTAAVLSTLGSRVELADLEVELTRSAVCGAGCPLGEGGFALAAVGGGLAAQRFALRDSEVCAVFLASAGSIDLTAGVVARAPVGACVQVPGYDLTRFASDVSWRDVERLVDTGTMLRSPPQPR